MNGELVIAEPIPVQQAIHWKPLHDAHYILASLQPADGGRRQIFVRQRVLAGVQHLLRASHGRPVGILVGRFYRCPVTGVHYEVIDSLIECSGANTDDLFSVIAGGLEVARQQEGAQVLGWYCSAPTLGRIPSGNLAAIHRAHFQNPWQTTLVVTGEASASGGAFFLYDDDGARWFHAPFHELLDGATVNQAKPTCIAWPQYLTVEQVVLVRPDELITTSADSEPSRSALLGDRSAAVRTPTPDARASEPPLSEPPPPFQPFPAGAGDLLAQLGPASDDGPRRTTDTREETATAPSPDVPAELPVERGADAIAGTPIEKTPTADERRQWFAGLRKAVRRARGSRGTPRNNEAEHYLEEARSAGFVVAATFPSIAKPKAAQALLVLVDPAAGILLTVVTTDAQVLDATLHYNVHTDEPALLQTSFPEHRDLASRTIYVRETCVDSVLARCRRLRETPGLEREWKVSPVIYFLTPDEWRFLTAYPADSEHDVHRIHTLNEERIRALAEPIRQQFGLEASPSQ